MSNPFEPSSPLTVGKIATGVALGILLAVGLLGGGWFLLQRHHARGAMQDDLAVIAQLSNSVEVTTRKLAKQEDLHRYLSTNTFRTP